MPFIEPFPTRRCRSEIMLGFVIGGLASGGATYLFISLLRRRYKFLISVSGIFFGILVGIGINKLLVGVYDIPLALLVGTLVGPIAAFRITRPLSFNN
jgi:hypothetical protein